MMETYKESMQVFDNYVNKLPRRELARIATICTQAATIPDRGHRATLVDDIGRVDETASILMQAYLDAREQWIESFVEGEWRWEITSPFLFKVCLTCGGYTGTDYDPTDGVRSGRNHECHDCESKRLRRESQSESRV